MNEAPCRKILVVEDEPILRLALQDALMAEGCSVHTAENGNDGLELFTEHRHDVVLTDMVMPGLDGLGLIERVLKLKPETSLFAFTAYGNVDTAVKAMKLGAIDFITKPFRISDLLERIRRETEREPQNGRKVIVSHVDERYQFGRIIGRSTPMLEVYDLIGSVAASDATILIRGESGTGKELVAGAIHYNSPRREQPFIKVSCASLSENLLESELFGHERGAFTGAMQRKIGRFEMAHKGTLFLDEIGDVSETVQVKLLRVLQEREFERVGGTETIHVDVRIVSATLHNIDSLVQRGRFREDLYYRINTITIKLPPLSERKEDIRLLSDHFRRMHGERIGKEVTGFEPEVYEILDHYSWPGNVRELKNVVERAVLLCHSDRITREDLPPTIVRLGAQPAAIMHPLFSAAESIQPLEVAMRDAETRHLRIALEHASNNRSVAAKNLGISRKTLWEKLKKYGIE